MSSFSRIQNYSIAKQQENPGNGKLMYIKQIKLNRLFKSCNKRQHSKNKQFLNKNYQSKNSKKTIKNY